MREGPLVAGCVAQEAHVQHTQRVLIFCIIKDGGRGFQIKGHKGFLDLILFLHIQEENPQTPKYKLFARFFQTAIKQHRQHE